MEIEKLRKKIDVLDDQIVDLLNRRANLTLSIGKCKIKNNASIYAPAREKQVLERVNALNQGPLNKQGLDAIYREIMSASLALEKPLRIAYLGPEATFSHMAALKRFGSMVQYVSCDNVSDIFSKVEHNDCDYGVVPIENSIEGIVTHTIDLLVDSDLKICSQILLDVSLNLMANCPLNKIKEVYSHPQPLGQCRQWLLKNLPQAHLLPAASTTKAAQTAARKKNAGCIASEIAASLYGLTILKKNIQDNARNITRFLVLSNTDVQPTGRDRTSLVFSVKDKVGALHAMLTPFYRNKINLSKIESRPSKKKAWDYYFFIDLEGHQEDPHVKRALTQLEGMCKFIKILGSYPVIES